jgi:hypothetical protein
VASNSIKVDYDDLNALDVKLTGIVNTMGTDGTTMTTLADAVGDYRLSQKIVDFAKSWAVHRYQINEDIEWIRDQVRKIATELEKTDADLASGLKDQG